MACSLQHAQPIKKKKPLRCRLYWHPWNYNKAHTRRECPLCGEKEKKKTERYQFFGLDGVLVNMKIEVWVPIP